MRCLTQNLINGLEFIIVGRDMGEGHSARRMLAIGIDLEIPLKYIRMLSVKELFFFRVLELGT